MKILIAEDDLVARAMLKRILRHMADEIVEASDGIEALARLSALACLRNQVMRQSGRASRCQ